MGYGFRDSVETWFTERFGTATAPQAQGWASIQTGAHTLIAAPTGSGKTLAAFLSAINDVVILGENGELPDKVQVLYVSPLKALSNDVEKNLQEPLRGVEALLREQGIDTTIRSAVRSGDTPQSARRAMVKRPPHILVTTPESLYILLTTVRGREMLSEVKTVIVDEIHAVAGSKRGTHLSLTLERLDALVGRSVQRIGLSATQKPMTKIAEFLVGSGRVCDVIDTGHEREIDLAIEVTGSPLTAVMSAEHMDEIYDRLADLIREHETTLIFANTRAETERITAFLSRRLEDYAIGSHHGALSKERRLQAEQDLKDGTFRALVATASLELGIDIGSVDLVCQVGSVRGINTMMQRVGRSGHHRGGVPKGRLFPLTQDELVEAIAAIDAVRRGELDIVHIPTDQLDILAQQIIAMCASTDWEEAELYAAVRKASPFSELTLETFESVLDVLSRGYDTQRGRRSAYIYWDQVNHMIKARPSARLTAITSGGAIPDRADYKVILDPQEIVIGTVHEDFAIEAFPGCIFQLGNSTWEMTRIESGKGQVRVVNAQNRKPTIPFWIGEAPARSDELSFAVSRLRSDIIGRIPFPDLDLDASISYLVEEVGICKAAAMQAADYLGATYVSLEAMPTQETIVVERFFDEVGNTHLVLHSPFGARLNRAWGLALRKCFCKAFNFELQAAANEDAIILSMGPTHAFPLSDVFSFLSSESVRDILVQALLDAPMFETRWRWNMNRSLAVPRFRSGKKVPPPIQRMISEDMLAVVFPDQIACLENIVGQRDVPTHPIVTQTIRDCLEEAMDIEQLEGLLRRIENDEVVCVARDVTTPSPLSHQIINAKPYAFLDDAPLEERRAQAIMTPRGMDIQNVEDYSILDQTAIDRVREEAWPQSRDMDELHDALVWSGYLLASEIESVGAPTDLERLLEDGRVVAVEVGEASVFVAVERIVFFGQVFSKQFAAIDHVPARYRDEATIVEDALREIVRGRLEAVGPTTSQQLADELGLDVHRIDVVLLMLESEGAIFRGRFDEGSDVEQWCDRRLLARIHRYTIKRLRSEIEPATPAEFTSFLFRWQGLVKSEKRRGVEGTFAVLAQLAGCSIAAAAWETFVLPQRIENYERGYLDAVCLSGRVVWGRYDVQPGRQRAAKTSPIGICPRETKDIWFGSDTDDLEGLSRNGRRVFETLSKHGALFFSELSKRSGLLATPTEEGLVELVASGLATSDAFSGLRALITSTDVRKKRRRYGGGNEIEQAGRWSLVQRERDEDLSYEAQVLEVAERLLARFGVVFRKLVQRDCPIPWRDLVYCYRRMEARGEIRGGRFVTSFVGEQFARADAVKTLRDVRRAKPESIIVISAADPLNLTGIVSGGDRIPSIATHRIAYHLGAPIGVFESGEIRFIGEVEQDLQVKIRRAFQEQGPTFASGYLGVRR